MFTNTLEDTIKYLDSEFERLTNPKPMKASRISNIEDYRKQLKAQGNQNADISTPEIKDDIIEPKILFKDIEDILHKKSSVADEEYNRVINPW